MDILKNISRERNLYPVLSGKKIVRYWADICHLSGGRISLDVRVGQKSHDNTRYLTGFLTSSELEIDQKKSRKKNISYGRLVQDGRIDRILTR